MRARIGRKAWNASALPQVTGLAALRLKIVRVFEFMPLTSAPGRIRTGAHGSGEGLLCTALTWPSVPNEALWGLRMGAETQA
jgi:hypothetical protein